MDAIPIDPSAYARRCPLRQVTSWDEGRRGGRGYLDEFLRKCLTVPAGGAATLAEIDGPGLLVRLYFTLPVRYYPQLLRALVLRVFWDGEAAPSVEVPLGDFFGCPFGRYRAFESRRLQCLGGGYASTWPMPFARGARVELRNDGPRDAHMVFYGLGYYEGEPEAGTTPLRFHAQWRRENPTTRGRPFTVLEAEGSGYFAGLFLQAQNRDPWLLRSPLRWMLPGGWGLGHLEGWELIAVDGEATPSFHGTGHEELFNMAWYFLKVPAAGRDVGCTVRGYASGRAAAYRFWTQDAIPFRRSLRFEILHGLKNAVRADYASVAYWYQEEPHGPFPSLPAFAARRTTPPFLGRLY